jgi:hypothetical protein
LWRTVTSAITPAPGLEPGVGDRLSPERALTDHDVVRGELNAVAERRQQSRFDHAIISDAEPIS